MEKSKEEANISDASASKLASENMPAEDISIKKEPEPMEESYIESDPEYEQGKKSL